MFTTQNNKTVSVPKWSELNQLNLFGFDCYMRQETKKPNVYLYYFKKQLANKDYARVVCTFENIEFCCEKMFSLSDDEIRKLALNN
jgi:hypothetical protein